MRKLRRIRVVAIGVIPSCRSGCICDTRGYGRLAFERLIFDELEAAIDPNAAKSFRRVEQGARRDYGQKFWWRPGTTLPRRGPDLRAVGG